MDRGRRNRRGRGHSYPNRTVPHTLSQEQPKPWSFINGLSSFLIMTSLIALIYLMLEYHCSNCKDKCDVDSITKSIDDIAKNLSLIKDSYYDLEMKISRFSQDLPKLEGQIDILEALANTMEKSHLGWDPKSQLSLPNVDINLNKKFDLTANNFSDKQCSEPVQSVPQPVAKTVDTSQD